MKRKKMITPKFTIDPLISEYVSHLQGVTLKHNKKIIDFETFEDFIPIAILLKNTTLIQDSPSYRKNVECIFHAGTYNALRGLSLFHTLETHNIKSSISTFPPHHKNCMVALIQDFIHTYTASEPTEIFKITYTFKHESAHHDITHQSLSHSLLHQVLKSKNDY
jgi:hypothetical protein